MTIQRLLQGSLDLETQNGLLREKAWAEYQLIQYTRELTPVEDLDDIHMEVEEVDRTWEDAVELPMLVIAPPQSEPLTKFGTDVVRDLTIQVPTIVLEDLGLVSRNSDLTVETVLESGDRFVFGGVLYEVLHVAPVAHWVNTYYPMFFEFTAKRYRQQSTEFQDLYE